VSVGSSWVGRLFTLYPINTMNQEPVKQEYVLREDGNFYRRSTVETIVLDQETAISAVTTKPIFNIDLFPHKFNLKSKFVNGNEVEQVYKAYFANHATESGQPKHQICFVEAVFFYFEGASLARQKDNQQHYRLSIGANQQTYGDDYDFIPCSELSVPPRWSPARDGLKLYFMFTFKNTNTVSEPIVERCSAPYVFVYDSISKASYAPNLPNVYERGDICAGDDFVNYAGDFSDIEHSDMLGMVKKSINALNTSRCNNDLRSYTSESQYVKFGATGASASVTDLTSSGIQNENMDFYQPINHEAILNFTSWLNTTT